MMYIFKTIIITVGLGCLTIGCQNPKKSSENQAVTDEKTESHNNVDEQSNDNSDLNISNEQDIVSEQRLESNSNNNAVKEERTADHSSGGTTGKEIIQSTAKKIAGRLNLDDQQTRSMLEILKKKYLETGAELSSVYTDEESKNIGRDLRTNAHEEIMSILNDNQKLQLEKSTSK